MFVALNEGRSPVRWFWRPRRSEVERHGALSCGLWVFGAALLAGVLVSVSPAGAQRAPRFDDALALAIVGFAAAAVLMWTGFSAGVHACARTLRGRGRYRALLQASATFHAPLMLLASVVPLLPYSRVLLASMYVSWLALYVLTARRVYGVRWAQGTVAVLMPLALFGALLLAGGLLVERTLL